MRIVFGPLLSDLPIVGSVQAYFLDTPTFDFEMDRMPVFLKLVQC